MIVILLVLFPSSVRAAVDLKEVYAFGWLNSLGQGVNLLIMPVFSVAAILLIFYLTLGAIRWMISRGDKNDLENAKNMITHSIIGFILLFVVFLLIQAVIEIFGLPKIF